MKLGTGRELLKSLFGKPMTVRFPQESIEIAEGYRGAHAYDIGKCESCGLCANICPNRAIRMVRVSEENRSEYPNLYPEIDFGKCCFCGLCQDRCPHKAIRLTKGLPLSTFESPRLVKQPAPRENVKP